MLRGFLNSLAEHTAEPNKVEVILGMDEDDPTPSPTEDYPFHIQTLRLKPGLPMCEINGAAYRASSGNYMMFVNDDILIETTGWDQRLLEAFRPFDDGIVLAHVNDGYFGSKLCIFPCMPRVAWEFLESGFESGYWRYGLDTHIYNVFKALERHGEKRIVYLEDVMFFHRNLHQLEDGTMGYLIPKELKERDAKCYDRCSTLRLNSFSGMLNHIQNISSERNRVELARLEAAVEHYPARPLYFGSQNLADIGIVIQVGPNETDSLATVIESLKSQSPDSPMLVLHHSRPSRIQLEHCMKVLNTSYLLYVEAPLQLEPDGMVELLNQLGPECCVAVPAYRDDQEGTWTIDVTVGEKGWANPQVRVIDQPTPITACDGRIFLLDIHGLEKLNPTDWYSGFCQELNFGLAVWENGSTVYTVPQATCRWTVAKPVVTQDTHSDIERTAFIRTWLDGGRLGQTLTRIKNQV